MLGRAFLVSWRVYRCQNHGTRKDAGILFIDTFEPSIEPKLQCLTWKHLKARYTKTIVERSRDLGRDKSPYKCETLDEHSMIGARAEVQAAILALLARITWKRGTLRECSGELSTSYSGSCT